MRVEASRMGTPGRPRSSVRRIGTVLIGAGLALPALAMPAMAAPAHVPAHRAGAAAVTARLPLQQSNWYWREQETNVGGSGVSPPSSLTDPTVPSGDLAVAGPEAPKGSPAGSGPDKESYLQFNTAGVPVGSTVLRFVITLPVDPSGDNVNQANSQIVACAPKSSWSAGTGAGSFSGKPADACTINSPKVRSTDGGKTYTVDVAAIATRWFQPGAINLGVALTDNPGNTTTAYQVDFGPASAINHLTATITYLPPTTSPPGSGGGGNGGGGGPAASGGSSGPGTSGNGAGGGQVSLPAPPVTVPNPPSAPTTTRNPGSAPVVAPESGGGNTAAAARLPALPPSGAMPPTGFWVAGALILLLLIGAWLTLSDQRVPLPARLDGPVARALRARRAVPSLVLGRFRDAPQP